MLQTIPSDEVQALMETMRIRQNEDKLKALETQRHREEEIRITKEVEDKKMCKLLIEAEAIMRLDIKNYDKETIEGIKRTIKGYPNMHIIELRDIIGCNHKHDYSCSSGICGVCGLCLLRAHCLKYYSNDPIFNRNKLFHNKRKEIHYEFINELVREVNDEIASENELLRLEALDKLRSNIDKANNALPSNKINGGVFEEDRLEIDYIISLDNPIPNMLDTRPSGLYFETRHLWESMNTSIQNRRNPRSKEIPVSWNNDYKDNKIPFLPQCPVCSNQNTILFESYGGQSGSPCYYSKAIDTVECVRGTHYKWDSNTNKHHIRSDNCLKEWDPSDPDGSRAQTEKKKKDIEEIQQQISELQVRLAHLKSELV